MRAPDASLGFPEEEKRDIEAVLPAEPEVDRMERVGELAHDEGDEGANEGVVEGMKPPSENDRRYHLSRIYTWLPMSFVVALLSLTMIPSFTYVHVSSGQSKFVILCISATAVVLNKRISFLFCCVDHL